MNQANLALATALLAPFAPAQTLASSALVEGQNAEYSVTGAAPNSFVFLVASLTGIANGPCLMPGLTECIALAPPLLIVDTQFADSFGHANLSLAIPPATATIAIHTQAVDVSLVGNNLAFGASNSVSNTIETIASFSDDFEANGLNSAWQILNPQLATIDVSGGALHITPLVGGGNNLWYNDGEGPLVYRNVTGDFTVSAIVHAHQPGNPSAPPSINYRLGGLLVRNPTATAPGSHEWAHIATGAGVASSPAAVENKTTNNSNSVFSLTAVTTPSLELRIQRRGANIIESYRELGTATWIPLATYQHAAFPETVQVGMMAYSANATPGISVAFDAIVFGP